MRVPTRQWTRTRWLRCLGRGTDPDGDIAIYEWTQISGTSVDLIDPFTPNPSFTAPDVDPDEELVF